MVHGEAPPPAAPQNGQTSATPWTGLPVATSEVELRTRTAEAPLADHHELLFHELIAEVQDARRQQEEIDLRLERLSSTHADTLGMPIEAWWELHRKEQEQTARMGSLEC